MNAEDKANENFENRKEAVKPFAFVRAENEFELCQEHLIPIHEDYDSRNMPGKEKSFQMLPRKFAANLLKIEGNLMFPEDQFSDLEKKALDDFAKKRYIKSARIAGKIVYFDLDSRIRKYLINVLRQRN